MQRHNNYVYIFLDCEVTALEFNLSSYELWSQEVKLSWKEKPALKKLMGNYKAKNNMTITSLKIINIVMKSLVVLYRFKQHMEEYSNFCVGLTMHAHEYKALLILHNTHPALCNCAPHTGLNISHRLPTTAEVSWKLLPEEQQKIVTGYTVQVLGPDTKKEISVADPTATTIEVPGLKPFTSYTFKVSAMTKAGTGPVATISSMTPKGKPSKANNHSEFLYIHDISTDDILRCICINLF